MKAMKEEITDASMCEVAEAVIWGQDRWWCESAEVGSCMSGEAQGLGGEIDGENRGAELHVHLVVVAEEHGSVKARKS